MKFVCVTLAETQKALKDFNWKYFSLDTETDNTLRFEDLKFSMLVLYDGNNNILISINPEIHLYLLHVFNQVNKPENTIALHNAPFDAKVLYKYGINIDKCHWVDTLVLSHLIDENRQDNKLKTLAKDLLGYDVTYYKDIEGKHDIHNKQFVEYSLMDAVYTYELANYFKPLIQNEGLQELYTSIEEPFLKVLTKMEMNGILVDAEKVKRTTEQLYKEKCQLEVQMCQILGIKYEMQCNLLTGDITPIYGINFNSSADLSKIIFDKLGLDTTELTKTGNKSTGKKTLDKLKKENEFVAVLDKYKKVQKLISAFYEPLPGFIDSDGRVRANYRDTGTVTGRLSCNNPNLQQLPKDNKEIGVNVRECFIASPGKKMIAVDYSGQEIRVLAHVTNDETLINALKNGWDLHLSVANTFFNLGIPEECLSESNPEYEKYKKKFKDERSKAKTITFGLAYGKGAKGFAEDFGISQEEGQAILDRYFKQFPKVKEAMLKTNKFLNENDYVVQLFGRKRRFQKMFKDGNTFHVNKSYRQAFNFLIQSPSADMIRLASIGSYQLGLLHPEWKLQHIGSVHDENIYEVQEEYAHECKEKLREVFKNVVQLIVPMESSADIGDNYGQCK